MTVNKEAKNSATTALKKTSVKTNKSKVKADTKQSSATLTKNKAKSTNQSVERFYATGRRKEAVARVWLSRGTGKVIVNNRDITQYFARPVLRMIINQPFSATDTIGQYDIVSTVKGSGLSGQAGALRLGISRALDTCSPDLHSTLRKGGFLTRDSRKVERKKFGHKKARKSFQFSKR